MSATVEAKPLPVVDTAVIEAQVAPFVLRAKEAKVTTVEEDESAKKEFQAGKAIVKFIETVYRDPKDILFKAHKEMCAKEKAVLAPVLEGLGIYESKCLEFKRKQEAEAKAIADSLAELARQDEEERQIREAIAADESGDKVAAAEILAQPVARPAISVQPALAKVSGVMTRTTWSAEVTDLKALVKFVAANCDRDPGVLCYLEAAMPVLNKEAQNKKKLLTIPGVRANEREAMSSRASGFRAV